MHCIEDTVDVNKSGDEMVANETSENANVYRAIILDSMAVVNKLKKDPSTKTCKDLAQLFIQKLGYESLNFNTSLMVFDHYIEGSVKERTREKRAGTVSMHYAIEDATKIKKKLHWNSYCQIVKRNKI